MDKAGEGDEEQKQQQQQQQPQGEESGWVKVIDVKIDQDQPPPVFAAGTTNEQFIRCSFCNSLMVRPQIAHMETIEVRMLTMFIFENICFISFNACRIHCQRSKLKMDRRLLVRFGASRTCFSSRTCRSPRLWTRPSIFVVVIARWAQSGSSASPPSSVTSPLVVSRTTPTEYTNESTILIELIWKCLYLLE